MILKKRVHILANCQSETGHSPLILDMIMALGMDGVKKTQQLGAGRNLVTSRRRFLRAAALGLPGIGLASCAGLTALAERFVPQELRGYDRVEAILDELDRRGTFFGERGNSLRAT
jgi:hypothetical protein